MLLKLFTKQSAEQSLSCDEAMHYNPYTVTIRMFVREVQDLDSSLNIENMTIIKESVSH